jgi:aspartate carbamoyltransferase catalytic subunit
VFNLFFESSTRTRTTFEIAAKRLSADVISLNVSTGSQSKGETMLDTVQNLEAMDADLFVVRPRCQRCRAPHRAPSCGRHISVVNAGDGRHAHPTPGPARHVHHPSVQGRTARRCRWPSSAIVLHSRGGALQIHALRTLGVRDVRVIAPRTLLPAGVEVLGVQGVPRHGGGLQGVDVVMMLRLQSERMKGCAAALGAASIQDYGLTPEKLALRRSPTPSSCTRAR